LILLDYLKKKKLMTQDLGTSLEKRWSYRGKDLEKIDESIFTPWILMY